MFNIVKLFIIFSTNNHCNTYGLCSYIGLGQVTYFHFTFSSAFKKIYMIELPTHMYH
jgi:hypothetical protein